MTSRTKKYFLSIFVIISSAVYVALGRNGVGPGYPSGIAYGTNPSGNSLVQPNAISTPGHSYKDGQYTGSIADAYYGNIQVKTVIQNGKIADVQFLDYPQDRQTSIRINQNAMPILKQEAIAAQSASVEIVSGATDTSQAFQDSLNSALTQATGA